MLCIKKLMFPMWDKTKPILFLVPTHRHTCFPYCEKTQKRQKHVWIPTEMVTNFPFIFQADFLLVWTINGTKGFLIVCLMRFLLRLDHL